MSHPSPPVPPRPELERRPRGPFGWIEAELLHDGWLAEIGPNAVATLVLLALAADRRGASFYGRTRMAVALGISSATSALAPRARSRLARAGRPDPGELATESLKKERF